LTSRVRAIYHVKVATEGDIAVAKPRPKRLHVHFPDDLYAQMEKLAEVEDRSMAALIRTSVREHIARQYGP